MKKLICLAVLLSVFVFTSTVAAYEPEPPDRHTTLKRYQSILRCWQSMRSSFHPQ